MPGMPCHTIANWPGVFRRLENVFSFANGGHIDGITSRSAFDTQSLSIGIDYIANYRTHVGSKGTTICDDVKAKIRWARTDIVVARTQEGAFLQVEGSFNQHNTLASVEFNIQRPEHVERPTGTVESNAWVGYLRKLHSVESVKENVNIVSVNIQGLVFVGEKRKIGAIKCHTFKDCQSIILKEEV